MKKTKNRARSGWRWLEGTLLLAGLTGLGLWGWSNVLPAVSQDWDSWVFESELRQQTATAGTYLAHKEAEIEHTLRAFCGFMISAGPDESPRAAKPGTERRFVRNKELLGRVTIPRLGLSAIVREGVGKDTLGLAVGHVPGTAMPGQHGNVGIAGHRDTLFRGLQDIQRDDLIRFETLDAVYVYQVESTEIVKPTDVGVLKASDFSELTLVTCFPFHYVGPAPDRFIVKARQVSQEPQHGSAAQLVRDQGGPVERSIGHEDDKPHQPAPNKRSFTVSVHHSTQLAPGISIGIDEADLDGHFVNGWMWLMPDRRTIWLRHQSTLEPVVFYSYSEGMRRELRITQVTRDSVKGYLMLAEPDRTATSRERRPGLSARTR
jgi:sortase A